MHGWNFSQAHFLMFSIAIYQYRVCGGAGGPPNQWGVCRQNAHERELQLKVKLQVQLHLQPNP